MLHLVEATNFYLQTLEKQRYCKEEEIQEGNFTLKGLGVLNLDLIKGIKLCAWEISSHIK